MALYIKVTKEVAQQLGLTGIRNRTADGNYLLWQADVAQFPGTTIFERAKYVGGTAINAGTAKQETDGVEHPIPVYTPERFGGKPLEEEGMEAPTKETSEVETPEPPTEEELPTEEGTPQEERSPTNLITNH